MTWSGGGFFEERTRAVGVLFEEHIGIVASGAVVHLDAAFVGAVCTIPEGDGGVVPRLVGEEAAAVGKRDFGPDVVATETARRGVGSARSKA